MADTKKTDDVNNQNRSVQHKEEELRDPQERPPHDRTARPSPNPGKGQEPPTDSPDHLENPPQSDGPRERNNDAV